MFDLMLALALTISVAGCAIRIIYWFATPLGPESGAFSFGRRVGSAVTGILATLFSRHLISILWAFLVNIIFQAQIFKQSPLRWAAHMFISWGFLILVLFHAMDEPITTRFFPDYAPTLDPFMLLRNLLGALVLAGALAALIRRLTVKRVRTLTRSADYTILVLVIVVITSGFFLESVKIISEPVFDEMVSDYMVEPEDDEVLALKAFWLGRFNVVFNDAGAIDVDDPDVMEKGAEVHEDNCMDCHSRPVTAFVSWQVSHILKPFGIQLNRIRADQVLWHFHYLAAFFCLALLPFSKFFHLISTSVNLLVQNRRPVKNNHPANRITKRALGIDACTHCLSCSDACNVAMIYRIIPNLSILPSEKIEMAKTAAANRYTDKKGAEILSQGSFICTECRGCTDVCPSGIDLQDLWQAGKNDLEAAGFSEIHHRAVNSSTSDLAERFEETMPDMALDRLNGQPVRSAIFEPCIQCSVCTSVCPVVALAEVPGQDPKAGPQQVMNLLRMGQTHLALGARMVWDCTTCYRCQESCPSHIRVADLLYGLRNQAWSLFQKGLS